MTSASWSTARARSTPWWSSWTASLRRNSAAPTCVRPIQYALSYPERWEASVRRVDWCGEPDFTFDEADERTFGCLALAELGGAAEHGTLPCAMNAAENEVANEAFRRGLCGFLDIERSVGAVMDAWDNEEVQSVEQLLEVDRRAREMACAQLGVAL